MVRGTIKNCLARPLKATAIWLICAITFLYFFHIALRNSSSYVGIPLMGYQGCQIMQLLAFYQERPSMSNAEKRSILYAEMEQDLDRKGAVFLKQGETSQSLSLSDLFALKDGKVAPLLRAANPPVRANVLHLSTQYSVPILAAVKNVFLPYFDKAIWFQNSSTYHFSMFHASHHITPVPAVEREVETEANAVETLSDTVCPLCIVLERVVLTSTGVLLGCWQVVSGEDPVTIRAKLKAALPHAPQKQLYNEAILHTSFARLIGSPKNLNEEEGKMSQLQIFHNLVGKLNNKIQGLKARIFELWYVQEYDLLALALNGKLKIRKFTLRCSKTD